MSRKICVRPIIPAPGHFHAYALTPIHNSYQLLYHFIPLLRRNPNGS
jgi:hypothetical protein